MLGILVQSRHNAAAATKFFRRLLKGLRYVPRVVVTDKLRSYGVRDCLAYRVRVHLQQLREHLLGAALAQIHGDQNALGGEPP